MCGILRPYELPQPVYAFWHAVGQHRSLGKYVQAQVEGALCDQTHRIDATVFPSGTVDILMDLAKSMNVFLHITK